MSNDNLKCDCCTFGQDKTHCCMCHTHAEMLSFLDTSRSNNGDKP